MTHLRKLTRAAVSLAAVVAVVWLLDRMGWSRVGSTLGRIGWAGAALLLALGTAESVLDAAALRVLVPNGVGTRRLFGYHSAGTLVNMIVPFELGEVTKGALIGRHLPAGTAVSGTLLWNYVYKLSRPAVPLALALAAGAVTQAAGGGFGATVTAAILAAALLAFLPYLALRLVIRQGMAVMLVRMGRLLRILRRDPAVWLERAERLDHVVRSFWRERPADYLRVFALQCLARTANWLTTWTAMRLLGVPVGFAEGALLYAAMTCAEYLLLVLPARLGVAEGSAYFVFGLCGLDPGMGILVSLLMRLRSLAANGLGALLALWPPSDRAVEALTTQVPASRGSGRV